MKQLPVVVQHLDGDAQFHCHHPRVALVHRLGHTVIHRTDQRQRRLPAATALALGSIPCAASRIVVFRVDELVTQCAAALALVEPVVEEYGAARLVPCAAQSVRQWLFDDADMLLPGAVKESIRTASASDMKRPSLVRRAEGARVLGTVDAQTTRLP